MVLFWLVAGLGIAAPWLVSAGSGPMKSTQANLQTCTVMNVYDGDTVTLKCEGKRQKVRLYCIDAPEMGQRPWGRESRDYLRDLLPRGIKVQITTHARDRYGRLVADVIVNEGSVNLAMVISGRASVYDKYCTDQKYHQTETNAKANDLGIWEREGLQQTPWRWRSDRR